jgi:hypothetical protein
MTRIERTWKIADIDGSNERTVTLAQYRAEIEAAKKLAMETFRVRRPRRRSPSQPWRDVPHSDAYEPCPEEELHE